MQSRTMYKPDRLGGQYSVFVGNHRVPAHSCCDLALFIFDLALLAGCNSGVVVANTFLVRVTTDANRIGVMVAVTFGSEALCSIHRVHTENTNQR